MCSSSTSFSEAPNNSPAAGSTTLAKLLGAQLLKFQAEGGENWIWTASRLHSRERLVRKSSGALKFRFSAIWRTRTATLASSIKQAERFSRRTAAIPGVGLATELQGCLFTFYLTGF
jgi:hypothetical protein